MSMSNESRSSTHRAGRRMLNARRMLTIVLGTLALSGCIVFDGPFVTADGAVDPAARYSLSKDTINYRSSAERMLVYRQVYASATSQLRNSVRGPGHDWAVVLDADETVFDNSAF